MHMFLLTFGQTAWVKIGILSQALPINLAITLLYWGLGYMENNSGPYSDTFIHAEWHLMQHQVLLKSEGYIQRNALVNVVEYYPLATSADEIVLSNITASVKAGYQNGFVYKFETDSEIVAPDNAISLSMCDCLPQSSTVNTALTFYQKMTGKPWIWVTKVMILDMFEIPSQLEISCDDLKNCLSSL